MNAVQRALRLGFAGTPQFAVPALEALVASHHSVVGVFTQPDRPAGRGRTLQGSPVKQCAERHRLPVHQPQTFRADEPSQLLRALEIDVLVVVAYGQILPQGALSIPRFGCLNIHASLLPRWRGAAPVQRAILAGDTTTGVCIMRMEAALDTGPVLARRAVEIDERETAGSLQDRLAQAGADLVVGTLDQVLDGRAHEQVQAQSGVTYAEKITKAEAVIDWNLDAVAVLRRVRAFNPWPVAETTLHGAQLRLWEAELTETGAATDLRPGTVLRAADEGIDVACGRGALRILRLQLAGRRALASRDFIKAHRLLGSCLATA